LILIEAIPCREDDQHGELAAVVGQFERLVAVTFAVGEGGGPVHHVHFDLGPVEAGEPAGAGGSLLELPLPGGVEVDGVGEDEARGGVYHAGGYEIFDPVFCPIGDPVVDLDTGCLRRGLEVEEPHSRAVAAGEEVEEVGEEGVSGLAPEGVGDVEAEGLAVSALRALASGGQLEVEGVEGWVEVVLREREVEGLGHLPLGVAAGSGVGHGEGD
jgi:hypothetical protein